MQPQVTGRRPCPWGSQVGNAGKPSGWGAGQRAGEAKGPGPGVGGHLRGGARAENLMADHTHTKATNVWTLSVYPHTHTRTIDTHAHRFINMHIKTQTPPQSQSCSADVCTPSLMHTHTLRCARQPQMLRLTGTPQHTPPSTLALTTRQSGPASLRPWPRLP